MHPLCRAQHGKGPRIYLHWSARAITIEPREHALRIVKAHPALHFFDRGKGGIDRPVRGVRPQPTGGDLYESAEQRARPPYFT